MAARTWTLLDVNRDVAVTELRVTAADVAGAPQSFSVTARRLARWAACLP